MTIYRAFAAAVCVAQFAITFVCAAETPRAYREEENPLPIIPGAVGFGMETPAGSGQHLHPVRTNIVRVTNLHDSGPGSLRDALENQPSPKVILFAVSGNIELQSGIGIGGPLGKYVKTNGNNTTFTNNISSEALDHPHHPKGPHSKGFLVEANNGPNTSHYTFFARNLLAHNADRNPRHANNEMLIVNNLIYDVRQGPQVEDGRSNAGPLISSVVGNYIIETKSTRYAMRIFFGSKPASRIYIGPDNFYGGKVQTDPWNSAATTSFVKQQRFGAKYADTDVPLSNRADTPPVWADGYQTLTASEARAYVLDHAGARPADRDPVDQRVVSQVRYNTKQAVETYVLRNVTSVPLVRVGGSG